MALNDIISTPHHGLVYGNEMVGLRRILRRVSAKMLRFAVVVQSS